MRKKSFIFLIIVILLLFSACGKNGGVEVIYEDDVSWESVEERWQSYHQYSGEYVAEPIRDIDESNIVPKEQIEIEYIQIAESLLEYWPDDTVVVHIAYLEEKAYYAVNIYSKDSDGIVIPGGYAEYVVDAMTGEEIVSWGTE